MPKHYFNSIILVDNYNKPEKKLDTLDNISEQLKTYGIRQRNINFQIPILTRDIKGLYADSNAVGNTHLFITGTFMSLQPRFSGINEHRLVKRGIGLRYIYNTGLKGVWFFDVSPFVTRDVSFKSRGYARIASTVVYSYNFSERFNLRGGLTKSFLWGNRLYLPFIGVRFGRLDKINISIQFPRSININLPVNNKIIFSLFSKPQGGMFSFANNDSLYYNKNSTTFHFTRYELNTGFRFDLRLKRINLYTGLGFSTRNNITFYSENRNKNTTGTYRTYFYKENPAASLFLNLGLVFKLGKARSIFNSRNLYDANDLNNSEGVSNNNAQIPISPKKLSKNYNIESIQDLIDYTDF